MWSFHWRRDIIQVFTGFLTMSHKSQRLRLGASPAWLMPGPRSPTASTTSSVCEGLPSVLGKLQTWVMDAV